MSATLLAPVAALLYLIATGLQLLHFMQGNQRIGHRVLALGLVALLAHAIVAAAIIPRRACGNVTDRKA